MSGAAAGSLLTPAQKMRSSVGHRKERERSGTVANRNMTEPNEWLFPLEDVANSSQFRMTDLPDHLIQYIVDIPIKVSANPLMMAFLDTQVALKTTACSKM